MDSGLNQCATSPYVFLNGLRLIGAAVILLAATVYAVLTSDGERTASLNAQQDKWGYASLFVMTVPVALATAALNWASLKVFKHNS